ncbi:FAD-dependent oxidoreductase [candidate division CSSED10-310 bacterium]|uniref:FAD-dependent oxidoreductase n=1 Tax=candidate division CSSED10-310 bacterium TaxID=2855610 RepID=A0ABV6YTJ6_UNCC1
MEKGFTLDQALAEASRCLLCHDAPCSQGCPAGTEPAQFIRKVRFMNLKGAVRVIKENNILGGVCGVVCPTGSLCEQGCVATGIGEPIQIGKIQRFLVEYAWQIGFHPLSKNPPLGKKVAIVGAGPAGLSCAADLAKAGCEVVIFEKLSQAGGLLQYAIPEHRLSREFVDREIADLLNLGVTIESDSPIESQADLDGLLEKDFQAVFLATGAWHCPRLAMPHQDSSDIVEALSFLMMAKQDRARFSELVHEKIVAVVGGGDTALDAAVSALKHGARESYLVYRRSFQQMPGYHDEKIAALQAGVHFLILSQPVDAIIEAGRVKGLKVLKTRLEELDDSNRPRPVPVTGTEHIIDVDLIVSAIGLTPDLNIRKLSRLELDGMNRIKVKNQDGATSQQDIYAGGDAVSGASLVVRAVADGKKTAAALIKVFETDADSQKERGQS